MNDKQIDELFKPKNVLLIKDLTEYDTNMILKSVNKSKKRKQLAFDIFMIFITSGLWLLWMLIRPKKD